jgi:hypothetical protein
MERSGNENTSEKQEIPLRHVGLACLRSNLEEVKWQLLVEISINTEGP